ncbi:hypothetical protein PR202_ga19332 [Eleusine coracana subsp. coracana]|uniref:Methyltransferase n=1 Tax=Eleusine coracana subsp. coracana TaxID=191504 RepID=A0AAV5CV31_ELECO|nr:hypothetical protein PR202_ga19332 [Eleusine coracana subsp. coracana]
MPGFCILGTSRVIDRFMICILVVLLLVKIWHDNMPYGKIAERKGHQGWMKHEGSYFIFPGGGTMFPDGAEQYIEKLVPRPPVRWKKQEKEWGELQAMTQALCYKSITVDGNTAIWKKPVEASCLPNQHEFGLDLCSTKDDPDEAWYFKLKKCISKASTVEEIAIGSIHRWPDRLSKPSARASLIDNGASLFEADSQKWVKRISYYKKSLGVKLGTAHIRNVMDMNAFFGGFAAAIVSDPVWVMNVVPAQKPFTLGVIYDRGLIGVYHDWCEPFSTYPRTYDLIHANGINSLIIDPVSGKSR